MNLKITYPDDFPLHGLDRHIFKTRLRNALRFCFYGNTVRQLAERLGAKRAHVVLDALPLQQIGDKHAFKNCMALGGCRIGDMSAPLRRNLLRNVGVRTALTISAWGHSAFPLLDEPPSHAAGRVMETIATNRQSTEPPLIRGHQAPHTSRIWLAAGLLCAAAAIGGAGWTLTRPVARLNATVVSMSPTQTLRDLASSVPDDHRPYRVSVQSEPQDTGAPPR